MKTAKRESVIFTFVVMFFCSAAYAQVKVGDNPATINSGSVLEVESINKGLMLPRVSLTNTTVWGLQGTATAGMQVYNSNAGITAGDVQYPSSSGGVGVYYWDGNGWVATKGGASGTQLMKLANTTYSVGAGIFTTPLGFGTTSINSIQGATVATNKVTLPAGLYRVGLTLKGQFSGGDYSNAAISIFYVNGIEYQQLSGLIGAGGNGVPYYGVAIVLLESSSDLVFANYKQGPGSFSLQSGVTTIERIE